MISRATLKFASVLRTARGFGKGDERTGTSSDGRGKRLVWRGARIRRPRQRLTSFLCGVGGDWGVPHLPAANSSRRTRAFREDLGRRERRAGSAVPAALFTRALRNGTEIDISSSFFRGSPMDLLPLLPMHHEVRDLPRDRAQFPATPRSSGTFARHPQRGHFVSLTDVQLNERWATLPSGSRKLFCYLRTRISFRFDRKLHTASLLFIYYFLFKFYYTSTKLRVTN